MRELEEQRGEEHEASAQEYPRLTGIDFTF